MREQEYLASLHRLRATVNGGFQGMPLEMLEPGFWHLDLVNGYKHWIVYMPTLTGETGWRGGRES